MSKRLLFVVHRYYPYPGGSEYYVRDLAECAQRQGHDVTVLAGQHMGDVNGVKLTNDPNILLTKFDLVIVHGGDVGMQDIVHNNGNVIPSPIVFMLIKPSESNNYQNGLKTASYIGCSTLEDWEFVKAKGYQDKAVSIPHSINKQSSIGTPGFKQKYNIQTKYMYLSCGGFWPHKAMNELVECFFQTERDDVTLVLTGYDNRHGIMPRPRNNLLPLLIDDRNEVMSAMVDADLYIMHSFEEGFGLVLLEAMLNRTPWAARNNAGARLMSDYGLAYNNDSQLIDYMKTFSGADQQKIDTAYNYVINNHMIENTVDSILKLS